MTFETAQQFTANPVITVEGTNNFRSAEGYEAHGGYVRSGSLFRSDAFDIMTARGFDQFSKHRISRVIDLRRPHEIHLAPNAFPDGAVEEVNLSLFAGAALLDGTAVPTISDIYQGILSTRVSQLVGAVKLIADAPEGGVVVHCTAGKDRTGMVVAVALEAVGVPREQVIVDYAASADNLAGAGVDRMLEAYRERNGKEPDQTSMTLISTSPGEALNAALETIDEIWGGAEGLLLTNGVSECTLDLLRSRLIG